MKAGCTIIALMLLLPAAGQKAMEFPHMYGVYTQPGLEEIIARHKTIAFIGETGYVSRRVNEKSLSERDSGLLSINRSVALRLYKAYTRKKDSCTAASQHPDTTMALLAGAGISAAMLPSYDRGELARILGVDAVVTARFTWFKKFNPGEATVLNIAQIAATFSFAAMGNYGVFFHFQAGQELLYIATMVHDASGQLLYMDTGMETAYPKMNPGGKKGLKELADFPYIKK